MNTLPCSGCRGLCCGPVPITQTDYLKIKEEVKSMPELYRIELKMQQRHFGTCIFYDLQRDKCGIHAAKPSICSAFGHYHNLVCFRYPFLASRENWVAEDDPIGVLSVHYKWQNFE